MTVGFWVPQTIHDLNVQGTTGNKMQSGRNPANLHGSALHPLPFCVPNFTVIRVVTHDHAIRFRELASQQFFMVGPGLAKTVLRPSSLPSELSGNSPTADKERRQGKRLVKAKSFFFSDEAIDGGR